MFVFVQLNNSIVELCNCSELPDLEPDVNELAASVYLEDKHMILLQCAYEEHCLSSSAAAVDRSSFGKDLAHEIWHFILGETSALPPADALSPETSNSRHLFIDLCSLFPLLLLALSMATWANFKTFKTILGSRDRLVFRVAPLTAFHSFHFQHWNC